MLFLNTPTTNQPATKRAGMCLLMALTLLIGVSGLSNNARASIFAEGSVVLVLKLVSATRVQPTTGVVVSADGLVLVSADFVSGDEEIVVMDGGVSIQTYARPAEVAEQDEKSGLAVLSVPGLNRQPILRSILISPSDDDLHLAAFPPGEQIASGDAPLWLPVDVVPAAGQNQWRIINAKTLPNVSGPVLDNCGFLAGMNLADGAQNMTGGKASSFVGAPLLTALKRLNIQLAPASCDVSAGSEQTPDSASTEAQLAQASREPKAVEETMPRLIDDEKARPDPLEIDPELISPKGNDNLDATATKQSVSGRGAADTPSSVWSLIPWWLWLLVGVLLAATVFKLGTLWRLVNKSSPDESSSLPRRAPVVEPPTIDLLRGGAGRSAHGIADHAVAEEKMPDISQLPDGYNAIVCVSGELSDNRSFSRYCMADKDHIDIVIGRGDADISIESPTISRQHARVKGNMKTLTLSDLGSNNGTSIGVVPCLPGEIMFFGPGDVITLGDVSFKMTVKYKIERLS